MASSNPPTKNSSFRALLGGNLGGATTSSFRTKVTQINYTSSSMPVLLAILCYVGVGPVGSLDFVHVTNIYKIDN